MWRLIVPAGRGKDPGNRKGERDGETGERVREGVEDFVLVELSCVWADGRCGLRGEVVCYQTNPLGSWHVLFPRIFPLLILPPLQALLSQSQLGDAKVGWF